MPPTKASKYVVKSPKFPKPRTGVITFTKGDSLKSRIEGYFRQHPDGDFFHWLQYYAGKLPHVDINTIRAFHVWRHNLVKVGTLKKINPTGRHTAEEKAKLLPKLPKNVHKAYTDWLGYTAEMATRRAAASKPSKPVKPSKPSKPVRKISVTVNSIKASKSKPKTTAKPRSTRNGR